METLATKLGCSVQHVYNLRNGQTGPSLAIAAAIETESKGAVSVRDWGAK